jgi:hypothetical protein
VPPAVFDLADTLVAGDTLVPFLVSSTLRHRGGRTVPALLALPVELALYAIRLRSAAVAKERLLRAFLGGESEATIANHATWSSRLRALEGHPSPARAGAANRGYAGWVIVRGPAPMRRFLGCNS